MQVLYSAALGLILVAAVAGFSLWITARDNRRDRAMRARAVTGDYVSDSGSWSTSADMSSCSDSSSSSCH